MAASGMKKRLFFDLAVSISIVVLVYINLIRSLLFVSEEDAYFLPDTGFYDYIVALFLIVFLAGLCFLCIQILRKINIGVVNVLASLLFFLALLNPAHFILLSFLKEPYHPEGLVYVWIMASKIEKTAIVFVFFDRCSTIYPILLAAFSSCPAVNGYYFSVCRPDYPATELACTHCVGCRQSPVARA